MELLDSTGYFGPCFDGAAAHGGTKEFIDLTSEKPPEEWTASKKKGTPIPRYLALASTHNKNIIWWDYDVSHWKVDEVEGVKFTFDPSKSPTRNVTYNQFYA